MTVHDLPLFDAVEAAASRDAAIAQVEHNADVAWKDEARAIVQRLARSRIEFTTDDVWICLEDSEAETHEPRALGAIMREAGREGLIRATNMTAPSTRPACNARPVRIWESLVVGEGRA